MIRIVTIFALVILGCFGTEYSQKVLDLYLANDDSKSAGRLLPTNGFEILEKNGEKIKIKISGFVNPKAPSVLYASSNQRVMVAAFSKNSAPNLLNVKKGENGAWDYATIEVWAQNDKFENDNKAMFAKAKEIYAQNCGICHSAHKETEFGANVWAATFNSMVSRTGIETGDRWLIIQYLQKHSKDFKETK